MAEYNKVYVAVKPELPKVIDKEQIFVYMPKASYDQAGLVKPDRTQFVIAGDYTLTIKHFTMTDDRVSVDVNMGYDNDRAIDGLDSKDFVTKGNLTGYAVKKLENNADIDKAYVEGANGTGTRLLNVATEVYTRSIAKRDWQGRLFASTTGNAGDNELVNIGYASTNYVKKSGVANRVYTTDNNGADSSAPFSNNAIPNTMAYRAYDGSLHGAVVTPADTTLLNNKYVSEHYIPVGSDGKIPNSYLPADIGADEIVSGYYFEGEFYSDAAHTTVIAGDPEKLYVDLATNKTYRWDATAGYVQVGSSLALGTTHDSAYYGDFGDKAYKHSQITGNPHNTAITDIAGLKAKLDTIDSKMNPVASNELSSLVLLSASNTTHGVMTIAYTNDYTKVNIDGKDYAVPTTDVAISQGQVIKLYVKPGLTPYCGTIPLATMTTLPCAWLQIWSAGTATEGDPTVYTITVGAPATVTPLNILCSMSRTPFTIPIRNSNRNLVTNAPVDQYDCINLGYWQANYKPFSYTTISTLSSVEKGFNVEYQVNGESAEIEIPLEGTDDIIVDIDETNKMINIHLDATVRAKLAKMLTLPATAPAKNSIVGVGTNNAQMIMTEQEARDAISVFKTVTISQTDYDNLAVKDSKTLYLITG